MLAFLPVQLTVNAATDDSDSVGAISESENNDDYASANSFSLNSTISGKMSSYDDADYYKITPTKNGKVELTFNNTYTTSSVYWNIKMYCYQGGSYTEFYNETIYANSGETRALPSIGASSGSIYYIAITTSSYYNSTGINYSIKNVFTATEYYEKEIDNSYSAATSMAFNQTYGGVMNNYGDVDYYKFTPSQNGKIALTFNNTYKDASVYWNIKMYCYRDGSYTEFYSENIYANSGETRALPSIGAVSGSVYYIVISTSSYYNSIGLDYSIKNVFTATEYYEKEIDNTYATATSMAFNQTYGGVMNNYGDVDYYKFTPSQNGKIALTFNNTFKDASVYWNIKMYCYQGGSYTEFYNETIYANSGETRSLPSIGAVSGSVYYGNL